MIFLYSFTLSFNKIMVTTMYTISVSSLKKIINCLYDIVHKLDSDYTGTRKLILSLTNFIITLNICIINTECAN